MSSDDHSSTDALRVAAYFDRLYGAEPRYWWRREGRYSLDPDAYPYSLLTQLTLRLLRDRPRTGPRALDLGAGEGTDAIRLALLGYQVTAVDVSPVATDKIGSFADEVGAALTVVTADVGQYRPEGLFDVIICNGVLHYVWDKTAVLTRIKEATAPGGLNVVSSWTTRTPVPDFHNSVPVYCDEENGAIASAYRHWDLKFIYFEHEKPEESHGGMPRHTHSHIKVIAEKPAS